MFVVIDGTDAAGKTSLLQAVLDETTRRFPDSVVGFEHKDRPVEHTRRWVLNDYVNSIERVDFQREALVADRWHWGEMVYGPKYRPETDTDGYGLLGKAGWRWTELFLESRGAARFWLYQPLKVVQKRLAERGDDFVQVDDLKYLVSAYKNAAKRSLSFEKLQPDPHSLEQVPDLARYVVDRAVEAEQAVKHLQPFPWYIGNPRPRTLLVGDMHSATKRYGRETTLPFMPVKGNSADYLLSSLDERHWRDVGIVNINDDDNAFKFYALWNTLERPNIVVLGRLAEKTISSIRFRDDDYVVVPHPQSVRRFTHSKRGEYGQAIARLGKSVRKDDQWILR